MFGNAIPTRCTAVIQIARTPDSLIALTVRARLLDNSDLYAAAFELSDHVFEFVPGQERVKKLTITANEVNSLSAFLNNSGTLNFYVEEAADSYYSQIAEGVSLGSWEIQASDIEHDFWLDIDQSSETNVIWEGAGAVYTKLYVSTDVVLNEPAAFLVSSDASQLDIPFVVFVEPNDWDADLELYVTRFAVEWPDDTDDVELFANTLASIEAPVPLRSAPAKTAA